jgi:hypothetical protein
MSNTTETELQKESLIDSYQQTTPTIPEVCQPGDTACINRWVQAFSDCD